MSKFEIDNTKMYSELYEILRDEYPNIPEDMYVQKVKERVNSIKQGILQMDVCQKLREDGKYNWNHAVAYAEELTENLPQELYQNVYEWINGKPISDIKYGGISIKDIMYQHKSTIHPFLTSLEVMLLYIRGGCKDKSICRKYFMWG